MRADKNDLALFAGNIITRGLTKKPVASTLCL
ncbi:hypothetical protein NIASO_09975 [Niabella soli DSM 19437]|uniref:Uncharacterized protein n=1 Tax=Niabella soli DSM 19437 TaxID=929713 RepID=W0F6W0_9BACT|nr:hypothetical protein NIASO_09975 [Niabella soli DSM 19437]